MLSKEDDSWFTDEHRHEMMERVPEITVRTQLSLYCLQRSQLLMLLRQLTRVSFAQMGLDERQSHAFCVSEQLSQLMAADALALLSSVSFSTGEQDGDTAGSRIII